MQTVSIYSSKAITGDGRGNISFYPRQAGGSGNTLVVGYSNNWGASGPSGLDKDYLSSINGMAAKDGVLYVANQKDNIVKKYSYTTPTGGLTDLGEGWSVSPNSTKLIFDKNNTLWLLEKLSDGTFKINQYSTSGNLLKTLSFPIGTKPTAITFDSTNKLYAGDSGIDQQIKVYDISEDSIVQTGSFGVQYGSSTGSIKGQTGQLRFRGVFTGLGFDSINNIYIATSAGNDTTLSSYNFSTQVSNLVCGEQSVSKNC